MSVTITDEGSAETPRDRDLDRAPRSPRSAVQTTPNQTKPSFLTTDFYAMIGGIVAVLVAAQQADNLDAPLAWALVAAIGYGYIVSRGLAKSGSAYRDRDYETKVGEWRLPALGSRHCAAGPPLAEARLNAQSLARPAGFHGTSGSFRRLLAQRVVLGVA